MVKQLDFDNFFKSIGYVTHSIGGHKIMEFEQLVKSRHSAVNFVEGFEMTEDDFKKIIESTKLAPSPYNLQHTKYLVITDKELKEQIYNLSYQQYKIHTASAVVIVLGDKQSVEPSEAEKLYTPMKMLKILSEEDYDSVISQVTGYSENLKTNPQRLREEVLVTSAISSAFFMLSAKNLGFDTCPMHIQNESQVRDLLNISDRYEMYTMVTIGKSVDKTRPRGYRKPFGEQVVFNKF